MDDIQQPVISLTSPQERVLDELCKDQTMGQACAALGRTANTVDRHRGKLFVMASAKTRVGLVRWAIRTGRVAA